MACGGSEIRKVYSQAELDAALADPKPLAIWICGDGRFVVRESAHVVARGAAHVEAWGSAHVVARGSAHVEAWESAHVEAWESAHVEALESAHVVARGSAHVVARGFSHVVARGFSHVVAWGFSHVVASKLVAVHRHSKTAVVDGGIVIEVEHPTTAEAWCEWYGVPVVDGVATLYKSVRADYASAHDASFFWRPGTEPDAGVCSSEECGPGLHFCPSVGMARAFHAERDARYLACPVRVTDIRVHPNPSYPTKVKAQKVCGPIWEVDRYGKALDPKGVA